MTKISNEWNGWVYKAGKPPVTLDFNTDLITQANSLAQSYIDNAGKAVDASEDFSSYFNN